MTSQPSLASLRVNDLFQGFVLVRMAEQREGRGGKYLDMTLGDKTGELNAKMWDSNVAAPAVGSVIKIRATVQEYNGRLQMRVEKMRQPAPQDEVDMSLLAQCAPEKPEDMLKEILDTVEGMKTEPLKKILNVMIGDVRDRLLYYPAAQRVHHAERSGLLHHTVSMLRVAKAILPIYPFLNRDLLLSGVIVHDLSKTVELLSDEMGTVKDYSTEGLLLGHLVHGVRQIGLAAEKANVTGEYVLMLEHMVNSHHGTAEFGSPRPPMFPEAEALHMIDDLDAKMNEMEGIISRTPVGAFSEKIWSLDRRIYHPDYAGEGAAQGSQEPAEQPAAYAPPVHRNADAYDNLIRR